VYDVANGILKDLNVTVSGDSEMEKIYVFDKGIVK